jgi:death-on-curing protein
VQYLEAAEVLVLHALIIDETGGAHGVRDVLALRGILEKPKMAIGGRELYRGLFKKAAVYLEGIARSHAFVDGNKRTALAATARFLFRNGYELMATNHDAATLTLRVVVRKPELDTVARWLRAHSRRAKLFSPRS